LGAADTSVGLKFGDIGRNIGPRMTCGVFSESSDRDEYDGGLFVSIGQSVDKKSLSDSKTLVLLPCEDWRRSRRSLAKS
jgi:hypothetical protein